MNCKCLRCILSIILFVGATGLLYGQDSVKAVKTIAHKYPPIANKLKGAYPPKPASFYTTPVVADSLADKSLNGQYAQLLLKLYHYQTPILYAFYKNVTDTLNIKKRELKKAEAQLAIQSHALDSLESSKTQALQDSESKLNSMGFLGLNLSKNTYAIVMWALVIVMILAFVALVYLSAHNRKEAAYRTKLYDDLSNEFQSYKIRANEREKKLARELQTERNKLDDLLGKK